MAKLLTVSDETTHIKSLRFHKPSIGNMCCTCAYREGRDHSAASTRSPQESPRTGAAFSWPPVSVGFLRLVRGERTGRRFALKVLEFHVITGTFPQGSGRWNDVHEEGKGWMVVLIARGEGIFSGPWSLGREGCSMSYIGLNEKGLTARQTRVWSPPGLPVCLEPGCSPVAGTSVESPAPPGPPFHLDLLLPEPVPALPQKRAACLLPSSSSLWLYPPPLPQTLLSPPSPIP